jgi:hypothetical protein
MLRKNDLKSRYGSTSVLHFRASLASNYRCQSRVNTSDFWGHMVTEPVPAEVCFINASVFVGSGLFRPRTSWHLLKYGEIIWISFHLFTWRRRKYGETLLDLFCTERSRSHMRHYKVILQISGALDGPGATWRPLATTSTARRP